MAHYAEPFQDKAERDLCERFLANGHVILPVENRESLDLIRRTVAQAACEAIGRATPPEEELDHFLNHVHETVAPEDLNRVRMAAINVLNDNTWIRPTYFSMLRKAIEALVGNELVMQRRVNLSVQLPGDTSSILPVHADVWDGDSAYEVVMWVPLVSCYGTKTMFLLEPEANHRVEAEFKQFEGKSTNALLDHIRPDLTWLDVPYGTGLIFSQNLLHGNVVNEEDETRWSMNCRFKSLFSPYAQKRLGEFFEPITMRPATRIGLNHKMPEVFDE